MDKRAPKIVKTVNSANNEKNKNKWYNEEINEAKRNLRKVEKKLLKRSSEENRIEFNRLKIGKSKMIEKTKQTYYRQEIYNSSNDSKELYRVLNGLNFQHVMMT